MEGIEEIGGSGRDHEFTPARFGPGPELDGAGFEDDGAFRTVDLEPGTFLVTGGPAGRRGLHDGAGLEPETDAADVFGFHGTGAEGGHPGLDLRHFTEP